MKPLRLSRGALGWAGLADCSATATVSPSQPGPLPPSPQSGWQCHWKPPVVALSPGGFLFRFRPPLTLFPCIPVQ